MRDYSNFSFISNGRKYMLTVIISSGDGKLIFTLDSARIECFEMESTLNDLVVRGSITYIDQYGNIDKMLERPLSNCRVIFSRNEIKYDGDIQIETPSDIEIINNSFFVENIMIERRNGDTVTYKIMLVSSNIYRCLANISYSNYNVGDESIFDILKACYSKSDLVCDEDSFKTTNTTVKIPYITTSNDNAFTVTKHLLNKLYYMKDKDDSMKFVFYNYMLDRYNLLDMKNEMTFTGGEVILLSLLRGTVESLIEEEEVNIGTVTRFPNSRLMESVFDKQMYDYDHETNQFMHRDILSESVTGSYFSNTFMSPSEATRKTFPVSTENKLSYTRSGSYWNNRFSIYDDMAMTMMKNNAMMIETSGKILRFPAMKVKIEIDRPDNELTSEDPQVLKDLMQRFKGLEGIWISSRVHSYVYPRTHRFRQVVTLMRNFTVKMEDQTN